jgi:hypothetical protein
MQKEVMGRGGTRQEREHEKGGALRRLPSLIEISGYFCNPNSNLICRILVTPFYLPV